MPDFDPVMLARWTGGRWTTLPEQKPSGFSIDSRRLGPGQLFVALRTERRDGHDFLGAAQAAGACGALVASPHGGLKLPQLVVADPVRALQAIAREHRRTFGGPVVGVSGSAGKTSTKDLLAVLLGGSPHVLSSEGNLNNQLGVPLTLTRLDPRVHRVAVIEAGVGGPGEMEPLARMIQPDIALITMVAPAHLAAFKGVEDIAREKAALPSAVHSGGIALFPGECEKFGAFRELSVRRLILERADVIRPAEPPKDRVYFTVTQRGDSTAIALAYGPPPPLTFTMRRVSDGVAQNAALAICAALWLGVSRDVIQERLPRWTPAPLRGEWRNDGGRSIYLDCYNANPSSMADSIGLFASVTPPTQPRLYILGGMEELGAASEAMHRALGAAVPLRSQDRLVAIGDQSRAVLEGAVSAGSSADQLSLAESPREIAEGLSDFRGSVFIKGSRRWQLERVLEEARAEPETAGTR